MPEAKIILSQAATYVACAPKSNAAYMAINDAMRSVKEEPIGRIPPHLQDAHYGGAKELGRGIGYVYPHDSEYNWVEQQYLPNELVGRTFYRLTDNGYEKSIRAYLTRIGKLPSHSRNHPPEGQ